jgi:VIT1/CCC1 family predicted Fe2+/Mn2+ transporter
LGVGSAFVSVFLSLITLVALGVYSGYISKQNYIMSVAKMVGLGTLIIITVELLKIVHLV